MKRIVGITALFSAVLLAGCRGQILAPRVGGDLFFSVGGTVTGIEGDASVVLQNNNGDNITVSGDGGFSFPTLIRQGDPYSVTVFTNPIGHTCGVTSNASGTVDQSVTSVVVTCTFNGGGPDGGTSGELDTTYGEGDGFTVHSNAGGGDDLDLGTSMTRDAQGRILVAGGSINGVGSLSMALWRYTTSGVLDTTFNGTGFVTHNGGVAPGVDPGGNPALDAEVVGADVFVDAAGRYVVVGYSRELGGLSNGVVVWRYTDTGALDTTLNGTGFVRDATSYSAGTGGVLDGNGRIVVTGYVWNGANTDFAVWRFEEDGDLDPNWNGGSVFTHHSAAGGGSEDTGIAVIIDGSGRVIATGYSTGSGGDPVAGTGQDMVVWRLTESGALDSTFNGSGFRVHNATGGLLNEAGRALWIDSGGRILVTGNGGSVDAFDLSGDDLLVWRFSSTGGFDITFNGTGFARHDGAAGGTGRDEGRGIVIDDTGRIVVAGISTTANGDPDRDIALWRYTNAGVLDTTFNETGFVSFGGLAGGTNASDQGRDLRVDATGNYVVTGTSTNAAGNADVVTLRVRSN